MQRVNICIQISLLDDNKIFQTFHLLLAAAPFAGMLLGLSSLPPPAVHGVPPQVQQVLPIVGMVVTISPSFILYNIVVFPAASSPTMRILISFLPNMPKKLNMPPMVADNGLLWYMKPLREEKNTDNILKHIKEGKSSV